MNRKTLCGFCFFCLGLYPIVRLCATYNLESFVVTRKGAKSVKGWVTYSDTTRVGNFGIYFYIYGYDYCYTVDGKGYIGCGYGSKQELCIGDTVSVRVHCHKQKWSRATGLRSSLFPIWCLAFIILPLVMLHCMYRGIKEGQGHSNHVS